MSNIFTNDFLKELEKIKNIDQQIFYYNSLRSRMMEETAKKFNISEPLLYELLIKTSTNIFNNSKRDEFIKNYFEQLNKNFEEFNIQKK